MPLPTTPSRPLQDAEAVLAAQNCSLVDVLFEMTVHNLECSERERCGNEHGTFAPRLSVS